MPTTTVNLSEDVLNFKNWIVRIMLCPFEHVVTWEPKTGLDTSSTNALPAHCLKGSRLQQTNILNPNISEFFASKMSHQMFSWACVEN